MQDENTEADRQTYRSGDVASGNVVNLTNRIENRIRRQVLTTRSNISGGRSH